MVFKFFIQRFKKIIQSLTAQLNDALSMLDDADAKIETLEKRVAQLENLIYKPDKKTTKKTSRNSNLPPSKDLNKPKRNNSLRKKSGKKTGGQKGHKGHFLQMSDSPNSIIAMIPKVCFNCGNHLNLDNKTLKDSKQEIDIPPIKAIVTQYDSYQIECQCGACNTGQFPQRLKAKVQYGPRVRALINYMSNYQYLPYKRLQVFFNDLFGLHFSQGTIYNTLERTAKKSKGIYEFLKEVIQGANVVGADETVVVVNGEKAYNWVWQNKDLTFIVCEPTRKKDVIYKYFPHGFPNAVLVSDRYSAHLSTPAAHYQICWAHLARLINFLVDEEDNPWIHQLFKLYKRAKILEKQKEVWKPHFKKAKKLEEDFNILLLQNIDKKKFPLTRKLCNSLNTNRHNVFTFLYHKHVPSHNNGAELAIRNAKVKMKISGQFKSGQNFYAISRSIIDTLIKNNKPILESILNIEQDIPISFGF